MEPWMPVEPDMTGAWAEWPRPRKPDPEVRLTRAIERYRRERTIPVTRTPRGHMLFAPHKNATSRRRNEI